MYLLREAYELARQSPDVSNQNGALIWSAGQILGTFYNTNIGCAEAVQERPLKYRTFEHAESGAIATGWADTKESVMVCPWACCAACARAIILAGIAILIVHKERMDLTPDRWKEEIVYAHKMLEYANVMIVQYSGPVSWANDIIVNGQLWSPATLEFV